MEGEELFYNDFALYWTRKHEKEDFEELVCQVKCPRMCWFSMRLKIKGKFCFITFRANGHFWSFCNFFALFGL